MISDTRTKRIQRAIQTNLLWFLPLGFYGALWFGLQAGDLGTISRSGGLFSFLDSLRATIPLVAIAAAIAFVLYQRRQHKNLSLFGPLGLTALYGAVGLIAALRSPSGGAALYWALAYLSVPLVLWAIAWNPKPLSRATQVVNLNWLVIVGGVVALFVFALFKMNLVMVIANPSLLLQCGSAGAWVVETSGNLRSTGVGRYAAISAIVALSLLAKGERRWFWGLIFAGSLVLLLSSGARTSLAGFAVGAPLVMIASFGKRAIFWGAGAAAVLIVLVSTTGLYGDFIDGCVKKYGGSTSQTQVTGPGTFGGDSGQQGGNPGESTGLVDGQPAGVSDSPVAINGPRDARSSRPGPIGAITGRTAVWKEGWTLFKQSPLIGYGFHADRIILDAHMHNAFMHSLVQTGLLGTVPFVIAILLGWAMFIRGFLSRNSLTVFHNHLLIQTGAILAFLSVRAFLESTGAFFGVDWLILAPLLLYLQLVNTSEARVRNQV